jgi:DNA-binding transcriptional regulator YiaG
MKSGSKYFPLYEKILKNNKDEIVLTISEIENVLGSALPSSSEDRSWWSNRENALQSSAWLDAGYKVSSFDLRTKKVTFSKIKTKSNYKIQKDEGGIVLWDQELIKGLREYMGLTQAQFAEELGVRQQTVSEWEQGIYTPTRASAKHLMLVAEKAGFYKSK